MYGWVRSYVHANMCMLLNAHMHMWLSAPPLMLLHAAMAANPLAVNLAMSAGVNISWGTWALAGLVPGIICLISVPLILYALYPPEVRRKMPIFKLILTRSCK